MGSVLIIGYGNELRGDDAAGYRLALRLTDDPRLSGVRVLVRRQLTPELALDISQAEQVILLDASTEVPAGDVAVRELRPRKDASPAWSHHLRPEALIGLAEQLYGASPPVHLVSVGVASLQLDQRLSTAVDGALDAAAEAVVAIARPDAVPEPSRA